MSSSEESVRQAHQLFPDPIHEWHLMLYDAADRLKRKLETMPHTPILGDDLLLELGVDRDNELNVEGDERLIGENDTAAQFFVPDIPQVAARRAQRWNQINRWPPLDPDRPETIASWSGDSIRTDLPQFDDIEETIYSCLGLVDWEVGAEEEQDSDERFGHFGQEHLCWARFT